MRSTTEAWKSRARDAVEDRVDRHARQELLLFERDAQLVERLEHLRVDLVQALGTVVRGLGSGVVADRLEVDRVEANLGLG